MTEDQRKLPGNYNVTVHVPFIHKFVMFGVTGFPLHDVTLCLLICQGDRRNLTVKKKKNKDDTIEYKHIS